MRKVNAIIAISNNNIIGVDGKLPWEAPEDMKFFVETTLNKPMICGKNTKSSLKFSKEREKHLYVMTRELTAKEMLHRVFIEHEEHPFIIGGAVIYHLFSKYITDWYVTRIDKEIETTNAQEVTFFPDYMWSRDAGFTQRSVRPVQGKTCNMSFEHYTRMKDFC